MERASEQCDRCNDRFRDHRIDRMADGPFLQRINGVYLPFISIIFYSQ